MNFVFSNPSLDSQKLKLDNQAVKHLERVGSIHRFRDGYGFGATVPTARNLPTLPPSIPMHRHPPSYDEPLEYSKPSKINKIDIKSQQRCNDQMKHQISGEYGKYLFDSSSEIFDLNSQRPSTSSFKPHISLRDDIRDVSTSKTKTFIRPNTSENFDTLNTPLSHRPPDTSRTSSDNSNKTNINTKPIPKGYESMKRTSSGKLLFTHVTVRKDYIASTVGNLDASFGKMHKYDLVASSLSKASPNVTRWCVVDAENTNLRNHPWRNKLRK